MLQHRKVTHKSSDVLRPHSYQIIELVCRWEIWETNFRKWLERNEGTHVKVQNSHLSLYKPYQTWYWQLVSIVLINFKLWSLSANRLNWRHRFNWTAGWHISPLHNPFSHDDVSIIYLRTDYDCFIVSKTTLDKLETYIPAKNFSSIRFLIFYSFMDQ